MPDAPPPHAAADPLDAIDIAWQPLVDRDRRPVGARLEIRAHAAVETAAALRAVLAAFGGSDGAPFPRGLILLAPRGMAFDGGLAALEVPGNVLLEVPASALSEAATVEAFAAASAGPKRVLNLDRPLPSAALSLPMRHVITAAKAMSQAPTGLGVFVADVASPQQAAEVIAAGAHMLVGWPVEEPIPEAPGALQPQQKAILDLIRQLQAEADPRELERSFRAEPVLSYLLMTLANSPAFRPGTSLASISQAISLLGYRRLAKWLVLLLVIASKSSRALPHIYTAILRGFLMENLADAANDLPLRDEAFITGAFSLLHRITGLTAEQLFDSVELPGAVQAALTSRTGPLGQLLDDARGRELAWPASMPRTLAAGAVNRATLSALASADALQGLV